MDQVQPQIFVGLSRSTWARVCAVTGDGTAFVGLSVMRGTVHFNAIAFRTANKFLTEFSCRGISPVDDETCLLR